MNQELLKIATLLAQTDFMLKGIDVETEDFDEEAFTNKIIELHDSLIR